MKEKISGFEREKILEQQKYYGKSAIDISKHLGVKLCLVKRVLRELGSADTPPTPPHTYLKVEIRNLGDLKAVVVSVIEKLENRLIEPKTANSIFYGSSLLSDFFKIEQLGDLEKRILKLERGLKCRA